MEPRSTRQRWSAPAAAATALLAGAVWALLCASLPAAAASSQTGGTQAAARAGDNLVARGRIMAESLVRRRPLAAQTVRKRRCGTRQPGAAKVATVETQRISKQVTERAAAASANIKTVRVSAVSASDHAKMSAML